jgi:hypothetical protein
MIERDMYMAVAMRSASPRLSDGVQSMADASLADVRCWARTMVSLGWRVWLAVRRADGTREMLWDETLEAADA